MDNTVDPKERPAFEKLYGKLPSCVPEDGTVPPLIIPRKPTAILLADTTPATRSSTDTVPGNKPLPVAYMPVVKPDPIYVVDGVRMPDSTTVLHRINPIDIASVAVLKKEGAAAKYGPEAYFRGVVLITLKKPQKQP
jgi:hypothetical protein